jgi:general secretion pathway protein B
MSYILDALRRAEADRERERGQVPGLLTQPTSGSGAVAPPAPRRWLPWAGGGLLLLAGIGAGSWWTRGTPESPPVPATPSATQPVSMPPAMLPPSVPAAAASLPMPPPAAPASTSPYLPPAPPPQAVAAAPRPAAMERAQAQATPVAPPAAAREAALPRLAELPENIRRELPRLAISGSVYSEDPAGRFVIINGEVQREGAKLGADLVLEQIGPRELVLRWRDQRFRQPV